MFDGNSFGLRIEGGNDSVAQDGVSQGFHVVHGHVITSPEQCPDLRTQNQLLASSWSRSPLDQVLDPFAVRADEIDLVQYGSDDTKTHRKIKHILGQKQHGKVGRLLVSELFTVGAGGWSGFPSHKHDTDRLPTETRHDETYNFRFKPNWGSGVQMLQREDNTPGEAYHIMDGSTICLDSGYHPCCVLPGYEMYYFTILGGLSQRSLVQYFQPTHTYQIETIPGIKDMIAKFK